MAADIKKLRDRIDSIDEQILKLYEERMDVAADIGRYKLENNLPIYDPDREDEKLEDILAAVSNREYADGAAQLFITLMQTSREMQEDMAGLEDDDYDDFNWDGEPIEIRLEAVGNDADEDTQ